MSAQAIYTQTDHHNRRKLEELTLLLTEEFPLAERQELATTILTRKLDFSA